MRPLPSKDAVQAIFGDRIEVLEEFRVGGQAVVFRAKRLRTPSGQESADYVAVKFYLDPKEDERVNREIETAKQVRHAALGRLLEYGQASIEAATYRCLIWKWVDGHALDTKLGGGPLNASIVARIGRDISGAINAIWAKRIVHRDVNPKNIILRRSEEGAVLIDLGIAKHLDRTPLTARGLTWGTMGYYSPEQLAGFALTSQSDVFSLGISLQQCLLARHPTNLDQQALMSGGPKTSTLVPTVPAILADMIDRMVRVRPSHRPTPKDLADLFAKAVEVL